MKRIGTPWVLAMSIVIVVWVLACSDGGEPAGQTAVEPAASSEPAGGAEAATPAAAAESLAEREIQNFIEAARNRELTPTMRLFAVERLRDAGTREATDVLLELLADGDAEIVRAAADVLQDSDDARVGPALEALGRQAELSLPGAPASE